MSVVDTRLRASDREAFLAEVRTYLPAFLSSAATERPDPVGDVSEILGLSRRDIQRVTAVHLALSEEVRGFIANLPAGLRSPLTSSVRPRVVSQSVRGGIDWGATIRRRAGAGAASTEFVIRPAQRVFDTPENRALAYALEELEASLRKGVRGEVTSESDNERADWYSEVVASVARLVKARRHHWLRGVPAERPNAYARKRLQAARTSFYRRHIPAVLALLDRYALNPTEKDLTELLTKRYFEPSRDWALFELVIALRLARAFASKSSVKRKSRLLIGSGRTAYARYAMPDGAEVRLWYQAWPKDAGASELDGTASRHGFDYSSRPDFVVQLLRDDVVVDALLLEAKATASSSYIGSGLSQLLGYLKERPEFFGPPPSGWLVAPPSAAFIAAPKSEDRELWIVSSDEVSSNLVQRFGY